MAPHPPAAPGGFDAFISYKRSTEFQTAAALSRALRRIGVPFYRRSRLSIFRDDDVMQAGTSLPRSLQEALEATRFLIVLCSPAAAGAPWVNEEIAHFRAAAPDASARILLAIAAGAWRWDPAAHDFDREGCDAIPSALAGAFSDEPYVVDLRFLRSPGEATLKNPAFRSAVAALAAPLHGVRKEALDGAEVQQARRVRVAVASVAVLSIAATAGGAKLALNARTAALLAEQRRVSVLSRQLADASGSAMQQGDYPAAYSLARRAWDTERTPSSLKAVQDFWERSRTARLPFANFGYGAFSPSGRFVATSTGWGSSRTPGTQLWDDLGRPAGDPLPAGYDFVAFTRDESRFLVRVRLDSGAAEDVLSPSYDRLAYRTQLELREVKGGRLASLASGGRWPTLAAADEVEYALAPWESDAVSTSGNGETVALVTPERNGVVWARAGDAFVEKARRSSIRQMDVTMAGDLVLAAALDGRLALWSAADGAFRDFPVPAPVHAVRFLPGDRSFVAVSTAQALVIGLDGRVEAAFPVPSPVRSIVPSPGGGQLLLEMADGSLVVHETTAWQRLFPPAWASGESAVQQRACRGTSKDGASLVAGRRVKTVTLPAPPPVLAAGAGRILRVCNGSIEAWSPFSDTPTRLALDGSLAFGALSPDGTLLLRFSRGEGSYPELQYVEPHVPVSVGHSRWVNAVVTGLGEDRLMTTSEDGTARIWDARGRLVATMAHGGAVTSTTVSIDRRRILTGSEDGMARLWSAEGRLLQSFAHGEPLVGGMLGADGTHVVTVGGHTVRGWSVSGTPRFERRAGASINAVGVSVRGELVTAANGVAQVWSSDGVPLCSFPHPGSVLAAAFSPEGRRVVTTSADNQVRVFDVCNDAPVAVYRHAGMVVAASFLDETTLVTGSRHGPVRLWNVGDGLPIRTLPSSNGGAEAEYVSLHVALDRQTFATATPRGLVEVWSREGALRFAFDVSDVEEAVLGEHDRVYVRSGRHVEVLRLPTPENILHWFGGRVREAEPTQGR